MRLLTAKLLSGHNKYNGDESALVFETDKDSENAESIFLGHLDVCGSLAVMGHTVLIV